MERAHPGEVAGTSASGESRYGGFDPLNDLLVAQKDRPAHLEAVNMRALTAFQRSLLVIDGTVTKFIEAYCMEPVQVVRLGQEDRRLAEPHPWLDAPAGTPVIAREVLLEGAYSKKLYAYAVSLLVFDRLPAGVRADLEVTPQGLGRILLDHRLETRRDVLWYGRERLPELADTLPRMHDDRFISRTYRIVAGGKPLMLINEKFPSSADLTFSHH